MGIAAALPFIDTGLNVANSAANIYLGIRQENFQERMANTAWQRQVKDMRAAGINPLYGLGGAGAPSPVGSSINTGYSGSSLTSAYALSQQAKLAAAQTENIKLQNAKTMAETANIMAQRRLTNATTDKMGVDTMTARETFHKTLSEADSAQLDAWIKGKYMDYMENYNSGKSLQAQKEQLENQLRQFDLDIYKKLKAAGEVGTILQLIIQAAKTR